MPAGWPRPRKRWRPVVGRSLSRAPGHQPVVLVSAEEWQRLRELESAESTAWWRRDAAERAASGEERGPGRMDPAWMRPLSAAALLTYSVTPVLRDQSGRLV